MSINSSLDTHVWLCVSIEEDVSGTAACVWMLLVWGGCPGKGEGRNAETSRGGWRSSGLGLWSYLEQTLFHMPTHFLLCPCQRSAAQWTYLSILRLPALHLPNPGCSKGKEKTDVKIKQSSNTNTIFTTHLIGLQCYWHHCIIMQKK